MNINALKSRLIILIFLIWVFGIIGYRLSASGGPDLHGNVEVRHAAINDQQGCEKYASVLVDALWHHLEASDRPDHEFMLVLTYGLDSKKRCENLKQDLLESTDYDTTLEFIDSGVSRSWILTAKTPKMKLTRPKLSQVVEHALALGSKYDCACPAIHFQEAGRNAENNGETDMISSDPYELASDPVNIANSLWSMMGFEGNSSQPFFVTGTYQVKSKEEGENLKSAFEATGKYRAQLRSLVDDDNDGTEYWILAIKTNQDMILTKQLLIETINDIKSLGNEQGFPYPSFGLRN